MIDQEVFDYACQLALEFPEVEFDEDSGKEYYTPHYTYSQFTWETDKIISDLDLSESTFYKQWPIISAIEAYGLDKEKFWYAVAYVKYLTSIWARQKSLHKTLPSAYEQLIRFRDEIVRCNPEDCPEKKSAEEVKSCPNREACLRFHSCHEFKVTFESRIKSHSIVLAGNRLMKLMADSLDELIAKEGASDRKASHEVPLWRFDKYDESKKTEMTWYAANLFKRLFDCLHLPVKRSRGDDNAGISLDKNQLIADLIHFIGLTDNQNLEGNSIKGILKLKKEFGLQIM